MTIEDLTLDTTQSIDIKADIGDVFRSVVKRLGEGFTNLKANRCRRSWSNGREEGGSAIGAMESATCGGTCR